MGKFMIKILQGSAVTQSVWKLVGSR